MKNKLTIPIIYRPLQLRAADDIVLYEGIKSVIQNKHSMIIGVFDCPSIDWTSLGRVQEGNRLIKLIPYANCYPARHETKTYWIWYSQATVTSNTTAIWVKKLSDCDHQLICFNNKTEYTLSDNSTKIPDYSKGNFNSSPATTSRRLVPTKVH